MILLVNGSADPHGSNARLLGAITANFAETIRPQHFEACIDLGSLPLFTPLQDRPDSITEVVKTWRSQVQSAKAVIITTPTYLYSIPAQLKNGLEWLATSGEMYDKLVMAVTYTPHMPRGEKAMAALVPPLSALNARIVGKCNLHQDELSISSDHVMEGNDSILLIQEMLGMLS